MRAVAKFAMRSPTAASISAAAYAVLALFFAPFMIVSGAIVAMSTLRHGATLGMRVVAIAGLIAGIAYFSLLNQPEAAVLLAMAWLPLIVVAQALRTSESQGQALAICGFGAALYCAAIRAAVPDVSAYWAMRLDALGKTVRDQGGTFFAAEEISQIASVMHESIVVIVTLFWICAILIARWWQSELFNPGGFGQEFRELVIPKAISLVAAVVAILALMQIYADAGQGLASDLLVVVVVLFAFQGLALIHHRAQKVGLAKIWLVGFYVLLILMLHRVGVLLALLGIVDTIIDPRRLRSIGRRSE
ncbi:MAG: hypothetical protein ACI9BW_002397 [Gammaproteobacteria bacterium]|jgi:hypothetical protein